MSPLPLATATPLHNRAPVQASLALLPAALAFYLVYDYPVARPWLALGLVLYGVICLLRPACWLLVLPILLPLLDLSPWSGRLFVQDIDFFLLVTFSACLWHGHYRPSRSGRLPLAFLGFVLLYLCSSAWSIFSVLSPWPTIGPNAYSSYYSSFNAVREARGFGWALLLWPSIALLFRRDPRRASTHLLIGVSLGLIGTGMVALWERGALHDLILGAGLYGRLHGLLDFTTPYRITGLLASMHTGGEAIDGYLALAWPLAAALALHARRHPWQMALGLAALMAGLYSAAVTFSRASYIELGLVLCLLALACALLVGRRAGTATALGGLLALLAFAALAALAQRRGGLLGLLAVLFACGVPTVAGFVLDPSRRSQLRGLAALAALIGCVVAQHAMVTSKWVPVGGAIAWPLAACLCGVAAVLGVALGGIARRALTTAEFIIATTLFAAAAGAVVPALTGYRMSFRLASVAGDLAGRFQHWQDALDLMPGTASARALGIGLGVFPRAYLTAYPDRLGGIGILEDEGINRFMRLTGGKDLKWTQRVALPPHTHFTASVDYRTSAELAELRMQVCRRHLIHPTEYNSQCRRHESRIQSTGGAWSTLSFSFDTGALGVSARNLLSAPLLFEITNRREYALEFKPPAIVDIDNVRLTDAEGNEWIRNGNFSRGTDYWFPLFDFNHLPWHVKNMAVAIYLSQGLVGCVGFLGLTLLALRAALRSAYAGAMAGLGFALAMTAFLAVGLVGTMVDEPRLMLLFYLYAFAAVALDGAASSRRVLPG